MAVKHDVFVVGNVKYVKLEVVNGRKPFPVVGDKRRLPTVILSEIRKGTHVSVKSSLL